MNYSYSAVVRHSARVRLVHDSFGPKYASRLYVAGLVALRHCEILYKAMHSCLCAYFFLCPNLNINNMKALGIIDYCRFLLLNFYCLRRVSSAKFYMNFRRKKCQMYLNNCFHLIAPLLAHIHLFIVWFFYFVCFYLFCVKLCLFLFYLQERLVQKLICLFPSFFFFILLKIILCHTRQACTGRRIANIQYMTTRARHTHSFSQYPSSHKEHLNEIYQLDLH